MRHCLYFALVQHKGGLDERLAVTGGAGVYDLYSLREFLVDIFDGGDRRTERIPVVIVIERIQQCAVLAYESGLCRSGACVNAEKSLAAVCREVFHRHLMLRMACCEFFIFGTGGEERLEAVYLDLHLYFLRQSVLKLLERHRGIFLRVQRRADGGEQMRVVRSDDMFVVQLERTDKRSPQL